jgi:hypothetical protein
MFSVHFVSVHLYTSIRTFLVPFHGEGTGGVAAFILRKLPILAPDEEMGRITHACGPGTECGGRTAREDG